MTDCEDEDDMSRSQSPMIPLTIENSVIKIKSEPGDEAEADYLEAAGHEDAEEDEEEEEELLNSSLTAMDWLPKLNARAGVVEEFVPEEERKPPYSYASLIRLAILSSPGQRATLADIYKWIQDQFLYYRNQTNLGWKNSIRHNLSLNKCFMKVARSRHDPGKGCYWAINQLYSQDKALPFEKRKKVVMLPSEALRADMTELQRTFLQTLQTRQLQLLLAEQGGAEAGSLPSLYPGPAPHLPHPALAELPPPPPPLVCHAPLPGPVPDLPPPGKQPRLEAADSCSAMLLDDWATTSEADLSQSLSRYMEQEPGPEPAQPGGGGCLMDTELVPAWAVKTEAASLLACVDPTEVLGAPAPPPHCSPASEAAVSSSGAGGGEGGVKLPPLPSLWSDLGRMSWLGANLDLFDWGRLREVPDPGSGTAEDISGDYDKLL